MNLQRSLVVVFPLVVLREFLDEFVQFLHPSSGPEIQLRERRLVVTAQGRCLTGGGSRHLHAKRAEEQLRGGGGTLPRRPPRPPGPPPSAGSRAVAPARGRAGWRASRLAVLARCAPGVPASGGPGLRRGCVCGPGTLSCGPTPAAVLRVLAQLWSSLAAATVAVEPTGASPGARKVKWKQCEIHQL